MTPLHVALRGIRKSFGGVDVLKGVDLDLHGGGVHALVGENGAGKSTLASILAGALRPDSGEILLDDVPVGLSSPVHARRRGITLVSQELTLVPQRPVAENVFTGRWPTPVRGFVSRRRMLSRYEQVAARCGFRVPARALVGSLNQADQQLVEIMRAVAGDTRVLILDEPTTAMTPDQSELVMVLGRSLAAAGCCVVLITHVLEDVLTHCDTVTVLRDGHVVTNGPSAQRSRDSLIRDMIGRPLDQQIPPRPPAPGNIAPVLMVRGLSRAATVRDVSLDVRAGEILGISGLVGSGRTELARCIVGADTKDSGEIVIDGRDVTIRNVRAAKAAGIVMIPESRKQQGLHLDHSVERNITLPHLAGLTRLGFIRPAASEQQTRTGIEHVRASAASTSLVRTLSGGNQQRVLFAKWIADRPRVLIADEPTRGVDVAGKRALYEIIIGLAELGTAVILISSELPEIIGLSHRVLVMRHGRCVVQLAGDEISEASITRAAFGETGRDEGSAA